MSIFTITRMFSNSLFCSFVNLDARAAVIVAATSTTTFFRFCWCSSRFAFGRGEDFCWSRRWCHWISRSVTGHLGQMGDAIAAAFSQESKSWRFYGLPEKLVIKKVSELIEELNPGFSAGVCQRLRLPGGNIINIPPRLLYYRAWCYLSHPSTHQPCLWLFDSFGVWRCLSYISCFFLRF